ncbi:hypothetical protein [Catenuloplanes atrovinosus]|uniref:Uncharacterized protein n=1 Tax=Catenuloplanes atrovinosus TaxID=137266 RepID=A0AAE4CAG8_9ACTN|nr:hypothetical protein [Catenuloplanes atrovinosus]MDR7277586.1 hypothetical protein [Catenuloplanes atrovinosus]
MTEPAESAPVNGRVRVEPEGRRGAVLGAVLGAVPDTGNTEIAVLLDDGTTVTVSATALAPPPHLANDPAAYTSSTAAHERLATRTPSQEPKNPSDYLDALAGMQAYRHQVDQDELRLIDAARANGATWQQIGLALGSDPDSAKQRGHRRRQALANRNHPD